MLQKTIFKRHVKCWMNNTDRTFPPIVHLLNPPQVKSTNQFKVILFVMIPPWTPDLTTNRGRPCLPLWGDSPSRFLFRTFTLAGKTVRAFGKNTNKHTEHVRSTGRAPDVDKERSDQ